MSIEELAASAGRGRPVRGEPVGPYSPLPSVGEDKGEGELTLVV